MVAANGRGARWRPLVGKVVGKVVVPSPIRGPGEQQIVRPMDHSGLIVGRPRRFRLRRWFGFALAFAGGTGACWAGAGLAVADDAGLRRIRTGSVVGCGAASVGPPAAAAAVAAAAPFFFFFFLALGLREARVFSPVAAGVRAMRSARNRTIGGTTGAGACEGSDSAAGFAGGRIEPSSASVARNAWYCGSASIVPHNGSRRDARGSFWSEARSTQAAPVLATKRWQMPTRSSGPGTGDSATYATRCFELTCVYVDASDKDVRHRLTSQSSGRPRTTSFRNPAVVMASGNDRHVRTFPAKRAKHKSWGRRGRCFGAHARRLQSSLGTCYELCARAS